MIETAAFGDINGRAFGTVGARARADSPARKPLSRSGDGAPGTAGEGPA